MAPDTDLQHQSAIRHPSGTHGVAEGFSQLRIYINACPDLKRVLWMPSPAEPFEQINEAYCLILFDHSQTVVLSNDL